MNISALLTRKPLTIAPGASLDQAMALMDEEEIRHLVVLEDARPAGVISDRDLLAVTGWLSRRQREVIEAPAGSVGEFMQAPALTIEVDAPVCDALEHFVEQRVGCLPVVRDGRLEGIVTETDVFDAYATACLRGQVTPQDDPPVAEHMTSEVVSLSPTASGDEAADLMREHGLRHLPVVDGGRLVGIVSDRDVRREFGRGQLEGSAVRDWMSANPLTARPDERLSTAARTLASSRISALPVVRGGELVGILSATDVLGACAGRLSVLQP